MGELSAAGGYGQTGQGWAARALYRIDAEAKVSQTPNFHVIFNSGREGPPRVKINEGRIVDIEKISTWNCYEHRRPGPLISANGLGFLRNVYFPNSGKDETGTHRGSCVFRPPIPASRNEVLRLIDEILPANVVILGRFDIGSIATGSKAVLAQLFEAISDVNRHRYSSQNFISCG